MREDALKTIIEQHALYLNNGNTGKRANLRDANLQGADLRDADLRWANLQGADLRDADLRWADLRWADLQGADLQGADLQWGYRKYARGSVNASVAVCCHLYCYTVFYRL